MRGRERRVKPDALVAPVVLSAGQCSGPHEHSVLSAQDVSSTQCSVLLNAQLPCEHLNANAQIFGCFQCSDENAAGIVCVMGAHDAQ